jgi:hypothetical protein
MIMSGGGVNDKWFWGSFFCVLSVCASLAVPNYTAEAILQEVTA